MVTHIVLLNIKPTLNKVEILQELESRLIALNDSIETLNHLEFGKDFNGSDAAYDAALYSTFSTKDDLDAYQIHPEHIKVKEYIVQVTSTRAVVDYEK
jgi:stress responsive alpha/beta barrel protein